VAVHTVRTEADLERVLEGHGTVVLDFWAPWCEPCREFQPLFEAAALRNPGMAFCRVNASEAKRLKAGFGVKSIPTLVVIRDRIMIAEQPGYLPADALDALLSQVEALDMDEIRREMDVAARGRSE
jgi:thioredoxin-like negative regulator of GroEL